jgi:hypothetical protein
MKNEFTPIKGCKGFDKDLKCRGFQFKEGETYETDRAELCESGFHFCGNPIDIFGYYAPHESKYHEVEALAPCKDHEDDSKKCTTKIKIGAEINLHSMVQIGVKFILEKVDWDKDKQTNTGNRSAATNTGDRSAATNTGNQSAATNTGNRSAATNTGYQSAATNTGDRSAATNTGDQSAATNTGDRSAATNTGYQSAATVKGNESVACGLGYQCKASGSLGCWLVLAERDADYKIKSVKSVKVDGKKIKVDTFYTLDSGKFIEVK